MYLISWLLGMVSTALEQQKSWSDREASSKADFLLSGIEKSETIIQLHVVCLKHFAGLLKPTAVSLQKRNFDLVEALKMVQDVRELLENQRVNAESEFQDLFREACQTAELL